MKDKHLPIVNRQMNRPMNGQMNGLDDQALLTLAHEARAQAYVPYSRFRVGAAVVDDQNRVFTGCNIENASYGATCCAERTAIFKAVSEGALTIRRIAVTAGGPGPCMPCGICRQVMAEFAEPGFYLLTDAAPNAATESVAGTELNADSETVVEIEPDSDTKPDIEPHEPAVLRLAMQELLPNAFDRASLADVPEPVAVPNDGSSVKK